METYMETHLQAFLQKFQHLKIQLEEIKKATNNFNDKRIGVGGFGNVYKGEVSHSTGHGLVAIKRLDRTGQQGTPEFLKEITMLSDYKHENVISLLGFCCEGGERILVYEYASRGSLDRYLSSPHFTWSQRMKVCLDAAKGLSYLHDPRETHRRLIHCDVKSGNILLDDQWNAKVSDLGLSIIGSANEQHSVIVTVAAGTNGYIDPIYSMTHTLTKESDVYSFGVVMFEVLCGRLCCTYSNGRVQQNLVHTWVESYKDKKLNDIIYNGLQAMDPRSLEIFLGIAYRCLKVAREDRPTMADVVTELERALERQEFFEKIIEIAEPPLNRRSQDEIMELVSKGFLSNDGKSWFSLNKHGEYCEMISIADSLGPEFRRCKWSGHKSRFSVGPYCLKEGKFKTHVKTQCLSPGITYTVNLVFKEPYSPLECTYKLIQYKLEGEKHDSYSHLAFKREDGWWMAELYQFTSDQSIVDLNILFYVYPNYSYSSNDIQIEGIEFQPLEKAEHKDENKSISDANWEESLPTDYQDIMKWAEHSGRWTTEEEAYQIMRNGFLISDDKTKKCIWFYLDNNGKKCHMLSAAHIWRYDKLLRCSKSRFGEGFQQSRYKFFDIKIEVQSQLVSSDTTYAIYLVYLLPKDQSGFEEPLRVDIRMEYFYTSYIYLVSPQIPVIRPKVDQNTQGPLSKRKGLPQERNDGWMEVHIWEFQTATTTKTISVELEFGSCGQGPHRGALFEGFEFRPI